ncbi:unnamed protein product [Soboliphyme baturini]|uniref:DUF1794 domain-containing protein n=1 Tax=Soboliphyme baturini TaxID=241478 RepID=A0A183IZW0_9BILA|nr:unnamed protein product [Soboliphyme baturini]
MLGENRRDEIPRWALLRGKWRGKFVPHSGLMCGEMDRFRCDLKIRNGLTPLYFTTLTSLAGRQLSVIVPHCDQVLFCLCVSIQWANAVAVCTCWYHFTGMSASDQHETGLDMTPMMCFQPSGRFMLATWFSWPAAIEEDDRPGTGGEASAASVQSRQQVKNKFARRRSQLVPSRRRRRVTPFLRRFFEHSVLESARRRTPCFHLRLTLTSPVEPRAHGRQVRVLLLTNVTELSRS